MCRLDSRNFICDSTKYTVWKVRDAHRVHYSTNVIRNTFEVFLYVWFHEIELKPDWQDRQPKGTVISLPWKGSSLFNPCLQQSLNKKKNTRHDNNEEHFYGERARKPRLRIVHSAWNRELPPVRTSSAATAGLSVVQILQWSLNKRKKMKKEMRVGREKEREKEFPI